MTMTFGRSQYGLDGSSGSWLKTSSAAPPSRPSRSASTTRIVVDELAARDVDEQRAALHAIDLRAADQLLGLRRVRRGEHDDVALREQIGQRDRAATTASTPAGTGWLARRRIAEMRNPNGAAIFTTSRPMAPRPTIPMRWPCSVRCVAASSSSCAQRCAAWARSVAGSRRASAIVTPSTCSAIDRARMPRALVITTSLASSSGNIRLPTPDRRALHPAQPRRRRKDVAIDERRERDVRLGQQTPQRLAIPGVEERVLRKVGAQPIDEIAAASPTRARG